MAATQFETSKAKIKIHNEASANLKAATEDFVRKALQEKKRRNNND